MLFKNLLAKRVNLAKGHRLEAACPLKAKREAADSTEDIKVFKHIIPYLKMVGL